MRALEYWKTVVRDQADLLTELLDVLRRSDIPFCIIGGQGANAYVDPVVSLDLDVVVAVDQVARLEPLLRGRFHVERFPHSLNVSQQGSDLRVQIQTDPRYSAFLQCAETREVLGLKLPVASVEDVLRGKVWAAEDPTRRPSKRQKDLADIARLLEAYPNLRASVPESVLRRLV